MPSSKVVQLLERNGTRTFDFRLPLGSLVTGSQDLFERAGHKAGLPKGKSGGRNPNVSSSEQAKQNSGVTKPKVKTKTPTKKRNRKNSPKSDTRVVLWNKKDGKAGIRRQEFQRQLKKLTDRADEALKKSKALTFKRASHSKKSLPKGASKKPLKHPRKVNGASEPALLLKRASQQSFSNTEKFSGPPELLILAGSSPSVSTTPYEIRRGHTANGSVIHVFEKVSQGGEESENVAPVPTCHKPKGSSVERTIMLDQEEEEEKEEAKDGTVTNVNTENMPSRGSEEETHEDNWIKDSMNDHYNTMCNIM